MNRILVQKLSSPQLGQFWSTNWTYDKPLLRLQITFQINCFDCVFCCHFVYSILQRTVPSYDNPLLHPQITFQYKICICVFFFTLFVVLTSEAFWRCLRRAYTLVIEFKASQITPGPRCSEQSPVTQRRVAAQDLRNTIPRG